MAMLSRASFVDLAFASAAIPNLSRETIAATDTGIDPSSITNNGSTPVFVRVDEFGGEPGGIYSPALVISDSRKKAMLGGADGIKSPDAKLSISPKYLSPSATTFKYGKHVALLQLTLSQQSPLNEFDASKNDQKLSWSSVWSLAQKKGAQIQPGALDYGATDKQKRFEHLPFTGGTAEIGFSFLWGDTNSNTADTINTVFTAIEGVTKTAAFGSLLTLPAVDVTLATNIQQLVLGLLQFTKKPHFEYEFGQGTVPVIFHKSLLETVTNIGSLILPAGQSFWIAMKQTDGPSFLSIAGLLSKKGNRIALSALNGEPQILTDHGVVATDSDKEMKQLQALTLASFEMRVAPAGAATA